MGAASALAAGTTAFVVAYREFALGATGEYVFLAVVFAVLVAGINSQGESRRALAKKLAIPV